MLTSTELGEYLKNLRKNRNLSLRKVDELTDITYSHLNMIENGIRNVTPALLKNLALIYNVDYLDLYEKAGYIDLIEDDKKSKIDSKPTGIMIPVLGYIRAGEPSTMFEDVIGYEKIDNETAKRGTFFGLKVKGDSMFPYILEDDIVIFKQQEDAENGQIVAITINGDDATVKELKKNKDGIELIPYNRMYAPIKFSNDDIIEKPVKIIGVFEELRRKDFKVL